MGHIETYKRESVDILTYITTCNLDFGEGLKIYTTKYFHLHEIAPAI